MESVKERILRETHDALYSGHLGMNRTLQLIQMKFLVAWYEEGC